MKIYFTFLLSAVAWVGAAQDLQVTTLIKNLNASGGLTIDQRGNLYVSDFGSSFPDTADTKVYKIENGSWEVSVFAEGFKGASGCYMDSQGNFYQSNPKGGRVSLVRPDGKIQYDFINEGLQTPVGVVKNSAGDLFICNCGKNNIIKADSKGNTSVFAEGEDFFQSPNGITIHNDTLYVVNFGNAKVIQIDPEGKVSTLVEGLKLLTGGPSPVGLGHITYSNGYLFATAIGMGHVYRISLNGEAEIIAGDGQFKNADGPAPEASFSKPNGIVASTTGDTLFINVSDPTWLNQPQALHPAHLVIITGVCALPGMDCRGKE